MLCANPMVIDGKAFGCGQCLPCRINKRRVWAERILLESLCHGDNSFVTLTYRDSEVPIDEFGQMVLVPEHCTKWLKRLRKEIAPRKVRYFLVGEYGTKSSRPHYHCALFGYPRCYRGIPRYTREGELVPCGTGCVCLQVYRTWGKGRVSLDDLSRESAGYIAGYTVKKMTAKDDHRLNGRPP